MKCSRLQVQMLTFCRYLRMATVRASGEEAQGQITSGFRPWVWNTFRKASHEDTDPETHPHTHTYNFRHGKYIRSLLMQITRLLTGISTISYNKHAQRRQIDVLLVSMSHHSPVEIPTLHQGYTRCVQQQTQTF